MRVDAAAQSDLPGLPLHGAASERTKTNEAGHVQGRWISGDEGQHKTKQVANV